MIYGLSGAAGVGKTTLGNLLAESLSIKYVSGSITANAKKHGYNAVGDLSLSERIDLQELLIEDHETLLASLNETVILDRTPIDMIGYMMGEVYMSSADIMSPREIERITSFYNRCRKVALIRYDMIFHLAPLDFYEVVKTRPSENSAYQIHTDLIMRGALSNMNGNLSHAVLNVTDLSQRQEFIHETIVERLNHHEAARQKSTHIN